MRSWWAGDGVCGTTVVRNVRVLNSPCCPNMKRGSKMQIVALDPKWQLSIRTFLRSEFVDSKCTQGVAWDLGCMLLRDASPRLMGVCMVDRDGYLRYLLVHDALRGKGWGSRMLQHCMASISTLTCVPDRVAFYERNGFVAQGLDLHLSDMVRMSKRETNGSRPLRAQVTEHFKETGV